MRKTIQGVSLELGVRLVMRSPVDTGLFRGNWVMNVGAPDTRTDGPEDLQPFGSPPSAETFSDWQDALESVTFRSNVFITNSLPYARVLEYGLYGNPPGTANGPNTINGYSKQAPKGILRVTVLEYNQVIEKVLAKVKSEP